jgi:tetratricopeptide (TPR) repeat protein
LVHDRFPRGVLQRLTGDYRAAIASQQQALEALCGLGASAAQGWARDELGPAQQETGDYAGAAASHQQALRLLRDVGEPYGQAQVLNGASRKPSAGTDSRLPHCSPPPTTSRTVLGR